MAATHSGLAKTWIRVEFFEASSQELLLVRNMPLEQLPDTFEPTTILELGASQWVVTCAMPPVVSDAVAGGDDLKLWLRRHHTAHRAPQAPAPAHDLFAPNTSCATLPATLPLNHAAEGHLWLYVQDWRQNELLDDTVWGAHVASTIEAIKARPLYSTYLRHMPQMALHKEAPTLQDVVAGLGVPGEMQYEGVVLFFKEHDQRMVTHSFAFDAPEGTTFYGTTDGPGGQMLVLGVHDWESEEGLREDLREVFEVLGEGWGWMSWENVQHVACGAL